MNDKTLDKDIKVLSNFNNFREEGKSNYPYYNRVCYEGKLLIASDGKILVYKTVEENPEGVTHFETDRHGKYKKTEVNGMQGKNQKIIQTFDCSYDFSFTLDFDYPLPDKLMGKWKMRYLSGSKVTFDFDKEEVNFAFNGGWENDDGCNAIYGDVIKDFKGDCSINMSLFTWQLLYIMKATKEKKLYFRVNNSYKRIKIVAGKYTFLCFNCDY